MNILLIYPRYDYSNAGGTYVPLGLLYIAAVVRDHGHKVSFVDMMFQDKPVITEAQLAEVDVVGFSFSTPLAEKAFNVAKLVKAVKPGITCIAGGPHSTVCPEECLKNGFDVSVIGEGELTFPDLLKKMEQSASFADVRGIAYLENDKIIFTPPRQMITDLDQLPFPARDLVDWDAYLNNDPSVNLITSRGCPYNCSFCMPMQEKMFGKKIRRRSPANVVAEIEMILQQITMPGVVFGIIDDTFTFSKEYVKSFCAEVESRKLVIKWWCHARVDNIDAELLTVMKRAGCVHLSIGVESGSQKILDFLKKGTKVEEIVRAFDVCNKAEIYTHAYIIVGTPVETKSDLKKTVKLLKRIRPSSVGVSRLTPMRGSYLYDFAEEHGLINIKRSEDWDYYANSYPLSLEHLSSKDLDEYTDIINAVVKDIAAAKKSRRTLWQLISGLAGFTGQKS